MKLALRKRYLVLIAGLAAIGLFVVACWIGLKPEPAFIRINFYTVLRIRNGMTRPELEAIFHVPPGEYSSIADPYMSIEPVGSTGRPGLKWEFWGGDSAILFVHFGPNGQVDDWVVRMRSAPAKPALDHWFDVIRYKWLQL